MRRKSTPQAMLYRYIMAVRPIHVFQVEEAGASARELENGTTVISPLVSLLLRASSYPSPLILLWFLNPVVTCIYLIFCPADRPHSSLRF